MLSLLRKAKSRVDTGTGPETTRNVARARLQQAITRDRYDLLAPEVMEALRRDALIAISRHLEVGEDFHELEIRSLDQALYLVASIRIQNVPRWAAVS